MVQLKLLLLFSLAATLGTSERHAHRQPSERGLKLGLWLQIGVNDDFSSQKRPVKFVKTRVPSGPSIPSNVASLTGYQGYVPYQGFAENVMLSANKYEYFTEYTSEEMCGKKAAENGDHFWTYKEGKCLMGTLFAPLCRSLTSNQDKIYVMEKFLTDGSPNDDPFPNPERTKQLMHGEPHVAFRVMPPTAIAQFPEFMTEMGHFWDKSAQDGKVFKLSKLEGFEAFDASIPIDPSCHTNSSCGVPFLTTSVAAVTSRHVALDQVCGQVMDLDSIAPVNVISHEGIGCKLFPCVYPTPKCELTVTSCYPISVRGSLSNFRKETCGGYKLRVLAFDNGKISMDADMCEKDAPTTMSVKNGKVKILLSGNPQANWDRYGFSIRLEKDTDFGGASMC